VSFLEEGVVMMIVFILGLPGSGKSTAAHTLKEYVPEHYEGWSVVHISDYNILKRMCYEEHDERLRQIGNGAFDVVECSAFNSALKRLKDEIREAIKETFNSNQLIAVEFSRNDYIFALEEFFVEFISDANFIFIKAPISECKFRIENRVEKRNRTEDDHYVSEFIFEEYYKEDQQDYSESVGRRLMKKYSIPESRIQIIEDCWLTEDEFKEIKVPEAIRLILLEHNILPTPEHTPSTKYEPVLTLTQ
jgi:adenylate kinase family enzyme